MTLRIETELEMLYPLPLPVTIRRPDMALVRRARTSEELTLEPGEYRLSAELPSGATLSADATVREKEDTTAYLRLDDVSDRRPLDIDSMLEGVRPAAALPEKDAGAAPVVSVAIMRGNVFDGDFLRTSANKHGFIQSTDQAVTWSANRTASIKVGPGWRQVAHFRQSGRPPINLWLPTSHRGGCRLKLAWTMGGLVSIRAVPEAPATAVAMAYDSKGRMWEAAATLSAPDKGDFAERMLYAKQADPIGAVVGAYTLLRMGELDRMRDWCDNLFNWFPELPDAAVILGEVAARRGDHGKAVETLLTIPSRGIPLFTEGLAMAGSRLRHYVGVKARIVSRHREEIADVLAMLAGFERWVDSRSALTRYPGIDPARPSGARLSFSAYPVLVEDEATAYARWTLETER